MSADPVVAIRMQDADDVAVVLTNVAEGQSVRVAGKGATQTITARDPIPQHHKIALKLIPEGAEVMRNGTVIGRATEKIEAGQYVHIHNLVSRRAFQDSNGG